MDFTDLNYEEFELLIGMLLAREGFAIVRTPRDGHPFGPDYEVRSPDGIPTFVEVKHFRRSTRFPTTLFVQFKGELARLQAQYPGARGILALSGSVSASVMNAVLDSGDLAVWNGDKVQELVEKHPDVLPTMGRLKGHRLELATQMDSLKSPIFDAQSFAARLTRELKNVPPGKDGWRDYEKVGTRALTELFEPALGAPDVQSRSEDGLDIQDAVFPIRADSPPWALVRAEYQSRFAVAEFKNHVGEVGQKQVESLAQYLWKKAYRSFGILVSRKGPDQSAMTARRRAWVEQDKLIVILKDEDLIDMAQMWDEDEDPFQVINAQLEEFFRRLSP